MVDDTVLTSVEEQRALERRLVDLEGRLAVGTTTVEEASGALRDWMIPIGPHWFMLHPAHRRWFIWDRLHESWEPASYEVGGWTLAVAGGSAGAIRDPV